MPSAAYRFFGILAEDLVSIMAIIVLFLIAGLFVGSLQRRPLQERFAGGEPLDVLHRGAGDIVQGLARQERLVCRDEHVGERQQSRQYVVLNDLAGEVLEEDAFLLLVNIQRHPAQAAAFSASIRAVVSMSARG